MSHKTFLSALMATTLLSGYATTAFAQSDNIDENDEIITVGTQIKGVDIAGILPVTTLDEVDIELTGAVSGDELLASIPQIGDVTFREGRFTGVNGARGDVGSVNLRGVGDGNTLVLLNGRRMVNHPGTQAVNQTPVVSVNSNAMPVTGIKRVEILRDGASAIYGSDAVAGVINTVLDDDYQGAQLQLQYGTSEGTALNEISGTAKWGSDFNDGDSNISVFGNFMFRNGMPATDLRNSSTEDLTPFFDGTVYEGDSQFFNRSGDTQWAELETLNGADVPGTTDDDVYVQPVSFGNCLVGLTPDTCLVNGTNVPTALRLDRAGYRDIVGDTDRYNLMAFVNHSLSADTELFGEVSYYHADYYKERESAGLLGSNPIGVAASAFHNTTGVDLRLKDYRPIDTGPRMIDVTNDSYRILGGIRGVMSDWDWEAAFLHSGAKTKDRTNRVSNTLFQQAINGTTASAYNIFAGGNQTDINDPNFVNDTSVIDGFMVDVKRDGTTKLTLADAKISNGSIFSLPGGDVGMAAGVEWRHESYLDDRDDRLDGTTVFNDTVTGTTNLSDVMGSSPTPDTDGDRDVLGAFVELAIPLISPEMNFPLAHSFDVQVAARAENYSDVGSVLKPKIAASWFPIEAFQVRGAYAEGFRAPNLEQINATAIRRVNSSREDWIVCHALAGGPNFTSDNDCDNLTVESVRGGGPDLEPESSKNYSLGATFEPTSNLTFLVDYWKIKQSNLVGIFGDQNQITLDYLLRLQGSSNPGVVRGTPDPTLAAAFTAAGLDPSGAGDIIEVQDTFLNLDDRTSEGIDFGAVLDFEVDGIGDLTLKANAAHILEFFQDPGLDAQLLADAQENGTLSSLVEVTGQADLRRENGNPEWRYSASMRWDNGPWGASASYRRVGDVFDSSVTGTDFDEFTIPAWDRVNLSADYTFDNGLFGGEKTRIRVGVRNVTDNKPPIADEFARGYFVSLHSNRGRYWHASVRHDF